MNRPHTTKCRSATPRGGFVTVVIIVVLAIAVVYCGAWLRTALLDLRGQRLAEDRLQAGWLAEAGLRRGAAQMSADGSFRGETWIVPGTELSRPHNAAVEIRIELLTGDDGQIRITAAVRYPEDLPRVRVTKSVTFTHSSEVNKL